MSKKSTMRKPSSKKGSNKISESQKIENRKKEIAAIIFFIFGIFLFFLALLRGSSFWNTLHNIYFGLFGIIAYIIPIFFMGMGVMLTSEKVYSVTKYQAIQILIATLFATSLVHIIVYDKTPGADILQTITYVYQDGVNGVGGGIFGGVLGWPLLFFLGKIGAVITIVLAVIVFILIISGTTLLDVLNGIKKPVDIIKEERIKNVEEKVSSKNLGLPNHPVTTSKKIDINLEEEVQQQKGFSFFNKKPKEDFNSSPMDIFIKQDKERPSSGHIDIPLEFTNIPEDFNIEIIDNNTNIIGLDEDVVFHENMEDLSEIEQLIRRAIPVEHVSLEEISKSSETTGRVRENDNNFFAEKNILNDLSTPVNVVFNETIKPIFDPNSFYKNNEKINQNNTIPTSKSGLLNKEKTDDPLTEVARNYIKPPLELLNDVSVDVDRNISKELKENAQTLVETLRSFGVETKVVNISRGPTVTRYELQPKAGVKISRITSLADDIALNLAAAGVRIEAPIPGKPAVGIEVPNKKTTIVSLKEIIKSNEFKNSKSKLAFALGKDITGKSIVADISEMPHVLIAGATGSGKSVCINSIITSLMYQASPDEVRFLMIDPKIVELGVYNGIPHLLIPVVTDPKKAAGALNWAVAEMHKRYNTFAKNQVRDLKGYNNLAKEQEDLEFMPQIVIIIDELSDLMMAAPTDVENSIIRLAQMARAAGMHLVVATQRPSVDVITGVIKANIPTRIAFSVSSAVDSRTILDSSGAEKLLGRGDMLFSPSGSPKPYRVQGCFVDDKEVEKIVEFLKMDDDVEYDENIIDEIESLTTNSSTSSDMSEETDDLLDDAIETIFENNQASTSFLQRRLRVGYARAARMMDMIEDRGIISPQDGSKPRDILITKEQWIQITMRD